MCKIRQLENKVFRGGNYWKNWKLRNFENFCSYPLILGRRTRSWSFFWRSLTVFPENGNTFLNTVFFASILKNVNTFLEVTLQILVYLLFLLTFSIKIAEKLTFYCKNLSIAFASFLITKHARLPSLTISHKFLRNWI